MSDTEAYYEKLLEAETYRKNAIRSAIEWMDPPQGSYGLDAGCGIGLQACMLAEYIGLEGRVTGLDMHTGLLQKALGIAAANNHSGRITFEQGSVDDIPFDDDVFDWAWSADCIGYPTGEPLPVLNELKRVVKPGGIIAILAMSSQCLLPGYPLLEARLNATCLAYAHLLKGRRPESHFMKLLHWYRQVGLEELECRTFAGNIQSPASDKLKAALASLFEMLWGERQPETSESDWSEYQRLCRPESPGFILNHDDYAGFITYTMFRGRVSGSKIFV